MKKKRIDEFENCDTYSEIIDELRRINDFRKKDALDRYDGHHGKLYRCTYIFQTFYPFVYITFFVIFCYSYISSVGESNKILSSLIDDWTGYDESLRATNNF